jgi:LPXTG-motif cell wall-anchored protein
VVIALGAVAAGFILAAPAGAIALKPSHANTATGSPSSIQAVSTPSKRAQAKTHRLQAPQQGTPLVGVFAITAGSCSGSTPTGTYFQMIEPGGTLSGPFLSNGNSPCSNQAYTPLSPGTAGGLSTVSYQPNPSPAFNGSGDGLADTITQPQDFFGINFALSTNSTDPQTKQSVPIPSISNSGGTLSGNLEAISVAWNNQNFNQGSPKPGGSMPGLTSASTGTYSSGSGTFTLTWSSAIVGGPFNNFTGLWHLEGTFVPKSSPPTTTTTTVTTTTTTTTSGSSPGSQGSSTTTTTPALGGQSGTGTSGDPTDSTPTLATTGLSQGTINLALVGLALVVSGICLLLTQRWSRRARC